MWFGLAFGFVVVRLALGLASAAFCSHELANPAGIHPALASVHSAPPAALR